MSQKDSVVDCPACRGKVAKVNEGTGKTFNQKSTMDRPVCCVCEGDKQIDMTDLTIGGFLKKGVCPKCQCSTIFICQKGCNRLICKMCNGGKKCRWCDN